MIRLHFTTKAQALRLHALAGFACMAMAAFTGQAQAARILVVSTIERTFDGDQMNRNCHAEFAALRASGNTVVELPGQLSSVNYPLTAADLSPAAGPYDIVVVCTVYNDPNAQGMKVITDGMKNRSARAFFQFDEKRSFHSAFEAAKTDWKLVLNPQAQYGTYDEVQTLNTQSTYASAFSGLNPYASNYYATYSGAPVNNVIYTPLSLPVAPNDVTAQAASTMVVPMRESYLDANGVAQGACLFSTTDISVFQDQNRRYEMNKNKIAAAFMEAIKPGGACSMSPNITKRFSSANIPLGGTTTLTVQVNNHGGYTDAVGAVIPAAPVTGLNVADHLPAPLQLAGVPTSTCTGGTLVGSAGQTTAGVSNATLPPAGCTITAQVTWPATPAGRAACTGQNVINTIVPGTDFDSSIGAANGDATAMLACSLIVPPSVNTPIPTLGQWALLLLSGLMAILGAVWARRRCLTAS